MGAIYLIQIFAGISGGKITVINLDFLTANAKLESHSLK
jgi:hypothetical protein